MASKQNDKLGQVIDYIIDIAQDVEKLIIVDKFEGIYKIPYQDVPKCFGENAEIRIYGINKKDFPQQRVRIIIGEVDACFRIGDNRDDIREEVDILLRLAECGKILATFGIDYGETPEYRIDPCYSSDKCIVGILMFINKSIIDTTVNDINDLAPLIERFGLAHIRNTEQNKKHSPTDIPIDTTYLVALLDISTQSTVWVDEHEGICDIKDVPEFLGVDAKVRIYDVFSEARRVRITIGQFSILYKKTDKHTHVCQMVERLLELTECVKILELFDMKYGETPEYSITPYNDPSCIIMSMIVYVGSSNIDIVINDTEDLAPILKRCGFMPICKIAQKDS